MQLTLLILPLLVLVGAEPSIHLAPRHLDQFATGYMMEVDDEDNADPDADDDVDGDVDDVDDADDDDDTHTYDEGRTHAWGSS